MRTLDIYEDAFDLQLFADDTDATGGADNGDDAAANTHADDQGADATDKGKDKGNQDGNEEDKQYSKADIDRLLDRKMAEMAAKLEKKAKAKEEAEKLAKMSDAEKQNEELKSLKAELAQFKEQAALTEMAKTARAILDEKNIHISDGMLANLITSDAEQTKKNVDEFTDLFNKAVAAEVKERLKGSTPKASTAPATMSLEEIQKITDRDERQRRIDEFLKAKK